MKKYIHLFTIVQKSFLRSFSLLLLCLLTATGLFAQRPVVNHDLSTQGSLTITLANFGNDYHITQSSTATATTNRIVVQAGNPGYQGTIILNGVNISSSGSACIHVPGTYNCSNLAPITKVNIVLMGQSTLTQTGSTYPAFQVDQGAQIHISAVDPNDNNSGKLNVYCPISSGGAAAIGAPNNIAQGTTTGVTCITGSPTTTNTAGGNIIISSGTIYAQGGYHGAGIGGGWYTYYNGIIVIYGGIVSAFGGGHAAGIGSGCPSGTGVTTCSAPNSTIIALPPSTITATGHSGQSIMGLAGAKNITYLNDAGKPLITVHTEDYTPNADIYLDLTETQNISAIFTALGINVDLTKVRVGRTNASGVLNFRAEFQQNTTFYTDATCLDPNFFGRPYLPVVRTVTGSSATVMDVELPLMDMKISFTDSPSTPLEVGYTATEAETNAYRIKVSYNDSNPLTNVSFSLQDGTDFSLLKFYNAGGAATITAPSSFTNGDVFYVVLPVNQGRPVGVYSDVLQITGTFGGFPLPSPIRRVIQQRVVIDDSQNNTHIKVTASPSTFTSPYPVTNTVTLTLNIDHTGTSALYDQLDVMAKYLITTEPNYDLAIAANPINSNNWVSMNIPAANNTNQTTIVPFNNKSQGVYYIHWYIESGELLAHSRTVISPPATYGGFGPYELRPMEVCAGTTVTFTGNLENGGTSPSYQWLLNSSTITSATASTYAYVPADGDVISCRMISNAPCVEVDTVYSQSITIRVSPWPTASDIVSTTNGSACLNGDGTAMAETSASYIIPVWYTNNTCSSTPVYGHSYTAASVTGTINLWVVAMNTAGSCVASCSAAKTVTINLETGIDKQSIVGPSTICIGGTGSIFTNASTNGKNWRSDNAGIASISGSGSSVTVTGVSSGTTTIWCILGGSTCKDSVSKVITVATGLVDKQSIQGTFAICAGTSTTLTNASTDSKSWRSSNTSVATIGGSGSSVTLSGISAGTATIWCVLSSGACKDSVSQIVTINAQPAVSITVSPLSICSGSTSTLTANVTSGTTSAMTYTWYNGGSQLGASTVNTYAVTVADSYSVMVRNNNNCIGTSNTTTLSVTTSATPTINISESQNNVCSGTSINYTSNITNGGTAPAYQWRVNGTPVSDATSPTYSYTPDNGDVVTCVLTSNAPCASPTTVTSNSITMAIIPTVTPLVNVTAVPD